MPLFSREIGIDGNFKSVIAKDGNCCCRNRAAIVVEEMKMVEWESSNEGHGGARTRNVKPFNRCEMVIAEYEITENLLRFPFKGVRNNVDLSSARF